MSKFLTTLVTLVRNKDVPDNIVSQDRNAAFGCDRIDVVAFNVDGKGAVLLRLYPAENEPFLFVQELDDDWFSLFVTDVDGAEYREVPDDYSFSGAPAAYAGCADPDGEFEWDKNEVAFAEIFSKRCPDGDLSAFGVTPGEDGDDDLADLSMRLSAALVLSVVSPAERESELALGAVNILGNKIMALRGGEMEIERSKRTAVERIGKIKHRGEVGGQLERQAEIIKVLDEVLRSNGSNGAADAHV